METNQTQGPDIWALILAPYGWDASTNASAVRFLKRYPQWIPLLIDDTVPKFDLLSMIVEATELENRRMDLDEIWQDFNQNGTTVPDFVQNESDRTDDSLAVKPPNLPILTDLSNHPKQMISRLPRKNRTKSTSELNHCVFCMNNGAEKKDYESHRCKDPAGNVICPVLQTFFCLRCKATGTKAHTAKYCPLKPVITPEDCLVMEQQRKLRERAAEASILGGRSATTSGRNSDRVSSKKPHRFRF